MARQPTMNTFGCTITMKGTIGPAGLDAMAVMAAIAKMVAGSWDSRHMAMTRLMSLREDSCGARVRRSPETIEVVMNTWAEVHTEG